ncbi:MAG: DUF58 domain-containing protein [Desulfobulbaceae bacterium]|nr:DUF58 domain-containing protein [Desulfobulbaceae bacterium]
MNKILYFLYLNISRCSYWLQRHVTGNGWLFLACLCLSAVIGLDTSQTMAFQFFCLLLAIGCLAISCCFRFRPKLSAKRQAPRLATAGVELHYKMVIENLGDSSQSNLVLFDDIPICYPTFIEFCTWNDPEEQQVSKFDRMIKLFRWQWLMRKKNSAKLSHQQCPDLPVGVTQKIPLQLIPYQRGVLHFSSVTFAKSDPFGLFRALYSMECTDTVVILPKRYPLPSLQLAGSRKYQPSGVTLASSVGESQEFMSLRDYRPGDPPRIIHWRSWAKTGKPVVKEYQDEYFSRHALILDTNLLSAGNKCFEESISVAASLACTVATQDSLLDLLFVGHKSYCFTAGRGVGHTGKILEILASVQPSQAESFSDLSRLVTERASLISSAVFVFLHWDEQRKDLVSLMNQRGIPVLALIISEDETKPLSKNPGTAKATYHRLHPDHMAKGLAQI